MGDAKLELSNIGTWLVEKDACAEAVAWVQSKMPDLEKVKADKDKTGTYNMDSSIYALEQFVVSDSEKVQWGNWYIIRIFTKEEYIAYGKFALGQMPENFDKKKFYYREAVRSLEEATKNDDPAMIQNVVACQEEDQYDVLRIILNYGIDLLRKRKMAT